MSSATTQLPTRLHGHAEPVTRSRGLWLRLSVLVHRARLDRMLAEGGDPAASQELGLRARQITSEPYRRTLADSFDRILAAAEGPRPRLSSAVTPANREVRAARAALLALCRALRDPGPVEPAGVALARQLLTDGAGPLYIESRNDALWHALRRAAAALDSRT